MNKFLSAWRGLLLSLRDKSMLLQYKLAALAVTVGLLLQLSLFEWAIWLLAVGLVLVAEGFNSCLERIGNRITRARDEEIAEMKDFAAGVVLLASGCSAILAIIIVWHHLGG